MKTKKKSKTGRLQWRIGALPLAFILCVALYDALHTRREETGGTSSFPRSRFSAPADSDADTEAWMLTLVNPWTSLPQDYSPVLSDCGNGFWIDSRCYDALQQMLEDCRADGLTPLICSAYRSWQTQQSLFDNKIERVMAEGYDADEAQQIAATVVATPGTSEHQLGLALDLVDASYQQLDQAQEETAVQQWLMENSWRYGFILRYPTGKSEQTGIIYEPWHYRYVGKTAAKEIYESGLCLEEYLDRRS